MEHALDRFLRYIAIDTQSSGKTGAHPSSPGQMQLISLLQEELTLLGAQRIRRKEQGVLYAEFPATPGCEKAPALGLIAHVDTSGDASGCHIAPRTVIFDGKALPLGSSGRLLDPARFPELRQLAGKTLIVTDGTTLLGADDKAGIAAIMQLASEVISSGTPHGKLCIAFTPDEEIGEGTLFFDVAEFGADFAYTVDGGAVNAIEYQNFNAAEAFLEFHGLSVHPGSAKDIMVHALKLAMEFHARLPEAETPEKTCGLEGFYHLVSLEGDVSCARVVYLLRDHDALSFERRHETMRQIAAAMNARYGENTVVLSIREQYRNMEEIIRQYPFLISCAEEAIRSTGRTPVIEPIRGGTDGAMLSFRGLPCPNLGAGGRNFHGEYEYLVTEELDDAVRVLHHILSDFAHTFFRNEN